MNKTNRLFVFCVFALIGLVAHAQEFKEYDIALVWNHSSLYSGKFVVTAVKNNYNKDVNVRFIDEYTKTQDVKVIKANDYLDSPKQYICNRVQAKPVSEGKYIDIFYLKPDEQNKDNDQEEKPAKQEQTILQQVANNPKKPINTGVTQIQETRKTPISINEIVADFDAYIKDSISFLSSMAIQRDSLAIAGHINNLRNWKDKVAYISEHQLKSNIDSMRDSCELCSKKTAGWINIFMGRYEKDEITDVRFCSDSLQAIITNRLEQRKSIINRLSEEVNGTPSTKLFDWKSLDWKLIGISAGLLALLTALFVWFSKASKNKRTTSLTGNYSNGAADASSAIVVRRKTTSILKKQNLDDVIDNDAYLEISCNDFCNDSAVRKMFIKNTCIKDIYNMYAEDLRNPNNPNEDGCMVLGRWVHDDDPNGKGEYYVSLEHVVLPGDDAVFSEYELNFGGKIKLKVTEKLKKLRRETNLQYDMTCWVHSHPGLGVFFSNSDSNVQMQLKHPTHPNFLTAIVVDILTPRQEMGIFTFKHDSSINSKADLKKLYSLEELYKWAVESERNTIKPEDYYNALADAKSHADECYGIELSNGAVIDMGMLVTEQTAGLVGMVHGFSNGRGSKTEYMAVTVSKNEAVPDNELVGCFMMATHCSIPSIRKAIASYLGRIKFVLVYTTTDGLLTSIPVVNQDLCTDENYYGEQKLEELKIWTRRRR